VNPTGARCPDSSVGAAYAALLETMTNGDASGDA